MNVHKVFIFNLVFFLLVLAGCVSTRHIESITSVTGYDFRKYTNEGFMITPEKISYKETIAALYLTHYPEANYIQIELGNKVDYKWQYTQFYTADLIDSLYIVAKDMGADAIMNFNVEDLKKEIYPNVYIPGVRISGLAIRR